MTMIKILTSIAILSITMVNAQETTNRTEFIAVPQTGSAISFETLLIDKKDIAYGADEIFVFEFKNTGTTPLIIESVKPGCGCTTVQEEVMAPIAPGKSSKLTFAYDTKRTGDFYKSITVKTNASEEFIILMIKGRVLPNPDAVPTGN